MAATETFPMTMDMTVAVQGLVNLFLNMDGKSREMFIKLLVVKMEEEEVDLILEVVDMRNNSNDDFTENILSLREGPKEADIKEETEQCFDDSNDAHDFKTETSSEKNTADKKNYLYNEGSLKDKKRNKNMQDGIKPFLCDQCPHASSTQSNLNKHKLGCHPENSPEEKPKQFLCEICSKSFGTNERVKIHIYREHTRNKIFKCDQCSYETTHITNIKDHKRTHTGERPFVCHICSKTFTKNQHVNRHIKGVHMGEKVDNIIKGEKNHLCDICSMAFSTARSLMTHKQSIHEGIRYDCDQCGYKAYDKGNLARHVASIHEGRKFVCEECGYEASTKHSLKNHEETVHLGVTHQCSQCDHKATSKGNLIQHVEYVHESIQHDCKECDFTTFKKRSFHKHMTNHRKAQALQNQEDYSPFGMSVN